MPDSTATPCGPLLVDLVADAQRSAELDAASRTWPSWDLTLRQVCDLELLMNGAFSPCTGFMTRADYEPVCDRMRLADGTLWPIPVTLDVTEVLADGLRPGSSLALRDGEGVLLAAMRVDDLWKPDLGAEAERVFGTTSEEHPGVAYLRHRTHPVYVGGVIEGLRPPTHYDFRQLRLAPRAVRAEFARRGWRRVVAFQTRNPIHRAHFELTLRAAAEAQARLLIHPVVGMTSPGDIDHVTRVRGYQAVIERYPAGTAMLALLPLAMRMAGPREALLHAIVRRNHGCTHLIVGRDHAGPGADSRGKPFYEPYEAQQLLRAHEAELGVTMVPFRNMVYRPDQDAYCAEDQVPAGQPVLSLSGTELRRRLAEGQEIPEWYTFPEVARELAAAFPPRHKQGLAVFFTGLSGAGKSTIANALLTTLLERERRRITLLDGDGVRRALSSGLGFSREHRDINIRRIGFVAAEIAKHGGLAICAAIAPYDAARKQVRAMVEAWGGFILVHVSTPLDVCEYRDRKGLYAKARAGTLPQFTGISDPYEAPEDADVTIDTAALAPEDAVRAILTCLEGRGYISRSAGR